MQIMRDVVSCIHNITGRIMVMDRKRKLEMAARLQIRWQRWELSNYDYLMKVRVNTVSLPTLICCSVQMLHCVHSVR